MGYQIPIFKEYSTKYNAEVHVVHWDHNKMTPYSPPFIENVHYYNRSEFSAKSLREFAVSTRPDIVYISGWMDRGYLSAARVLRKRRVPVVPGFDDIWQGTLRQRIASYIFPIVKNFYFSHAWVAGPYQFEFAKRLGFKNNQIIFNCLSADLRIFNDSYSKSIGAKSLKYPHRFVYAGRFEPVKGVDILIKAWKNIQKEKKDWELCFIGNGSFCDELKNHEGVIIQDFMQPELLVEEIYKCGCFILPSRKDQWGLVLHEFSAAGIPLICSDMCGAAVVFISKNYNGFIFKSGDIKDIERQMLKIINLSDHELIRMAENSHLMGQKITPELSASNFISILSD